MAIFNSYVSHYQRVMMTYIDPVHLSRSIALLDLLLRPASLQSKHCGVGTLDAGRRIGCGTIGGQLSEVG